MATCKDCIHERVCFALIKSGLPYDDLLPAEAFCMTFKNKADVVEIVRCKDCVYIRESEKTNKVFCLYHGDDYEFETYQNKFCSDGVKAKLKEREGK